MAITPTCDRCQTELTGFGGILLSPPDKTGMVKKLHLCVACYHRIIGEFPDRIVVRRER